MIKKIVIFPIKLYQKFISPALGNHCRFYPTCSEYMVQAINVHGILKGLILGIYRILRCNPFCKCGHDPVPPKNRWKNN